MATALQGFSVDIDTVKAYHAMNKERKELYLSMKYSDDGKKIILDEKGPLKSKNAKTLAEKNKHWETLLAKLPEDQIRYVTIQVDYKDAKGAAQNDILFVAWVPDGVDIMKKMEVDKHKVSIMKCLPGLRENVVVNSKADWDVAKIVASKLKGKVE